METLSFKFTPKKDDFISVVRATYALDSLKWLFVVLLLIVALPTTLTLLAGGLAYIGYALPLLCLMGFVAYLYFLMPAALAQQMQNDRQLSAETTCQVNDQGVTLKNQFTETKYNWDIFKRAVETESHYLLYYSMNRRMIQILPKRAFESSEQEAAFRELLTRKIKGFRAR